MAVPAISGRISLTLDSGNDLFTGYIAQTQLTSMRVGRIAGGLSLRGRRAERRDADGSKAPPPHPPFVDRSGAARSISLRRSVAGLV